MRLTRSFNRILGLAVLLVGAGIAIPVRSAHAADHVDGYVGWDGPCMMLQQHDGTTLSLGGEVRGLRSGDHVRLEGYVEPGNRRCSASAFNVSFVQTLWADDHHRNTYFDHLNGSPFLAWAEQNGRYERRSEEHERNGRINRSSAGSGYVYRGAYRRMNLVGRLDLSQPGCPVLVTENADFALDGSLGSYQHGDRVRVDGFFYDQDPNAPCGSTLVVHGIRGH
jgi:hypothetical protein